MTLFSVSFEAFKKSLSPPSYCFYTGQLGIWPGKWKRETFERKSQEPTPSQRRWPGFRGGGEWQWRHNPTFIWCHLPKQSSSFSSLSPSGAGLQVKQQGTPDAQISRKAAQQTGFWSRERWRVAVREISAEVRARCRQAVNSQWATKDRQVSVKWILQWNISKEKWQKYPWQELNPWITWNHCGTEVLFFSERRDCSTCRCSIVSFVNNFAELQERRIRGG